MELTPGTVLLGKYRVDDQLGIGGMARVVRATHLFLQQAVAIKVLLPEMVENDSTVARFLREAQATVKLRSEHIARVQDVGTFEDGTPFMVMEYLDGNDLNQILRHHGPQSPSVVVDLMLQACEGICEAHANGIVHRDIKPSNFFITRRPDGSMLLKILDFGISKAPVGYDDLTGSQAVLGTPTYMAPEQMKSGKSADPRSDIWSLGVVMYQLLNGRPPFVGETYAELILKVGGEAPTPMHVALPAGLGEIIYRCLEKSPSARFQDAAELARSLAPFATDPTMGAQSALRASRILTTVRNSRVGIPLAGVSDLATPVPIAPAQMPSYSTAGSSLSHGRGQATAVTKGGRGWMVAGITALVIIAGAGGFFASRMTKSEATPAATAPPAQPLVTPTPVVVTPPPPAKEQGSGSAEPAFTPTLPEVKAEAKVEDDPKATGTSGTASGTGTGGTTSANGTGGTTSANGTGGTTSANGTGGTGGTMVKSTSGTTTSGTTTSATTASGTTSKSTGGTTSKTANGTTTSGTSSGTGGAGGTATSKSTSNAGGANGTAAITATSSGTAAKSTATKSATSGTTGATAKTGSTTGSTTAKTTTTKKTTTKKSSSGGLFDSRK